MSWRQRVLAVISHPQFALMLLSLGSLGLMIELYNPGLIFPGVIGAISLLLAFYSLQTLPDQLRRAAADRSGHGDVRSGGQHFQLRHADARRRGGHVPGRASC